jgi:hypothetical protein
MDVSTAAKESLAECLIRGDPNYGARLVNNLGWQLTSWVIRSQRFWLTWADIHYNNHPLMRRSTLSLRLIFALLARFGVGCINGITGLLPYIWESIKWYADPYCYKCCPCVDDNLMYYRDKAINDTIIALGGFASWFCYERALYFLQGMSGIWIIATLGFLSYRLMKKSWHEGFGWLAFLAPAGNEIFDAKVHGKLSDYPRALIPLFAWINNISIGKTVFSRPSSRQGSPMPFIANNKMLSNLFTFKHDNPRTWWHIVFCPCYWSLCVVFCPIQTLIGLAGSIVDLFPCNKKKKTQ